jgi:hypothetical protein
MWYNQTGTYGTKAWMIKDILPENQISLNFDILRLPYKNRICQRQCVLSKRC